MFDLEKREIGRCLELRNVDNVWVVIGAFKEVKFDGDKAENLSKLVAKIEELDWDKGLDTWNRVFDFKGEIYPNKNKEKEEEDKSSNGEEPEKRAKNDDKSSTVPLYRFTCYRLV